LQPNINFASITPVAVAVQQNKKVCEFAMSLGKM